MNYRPKTKAIVVTMQSEDDVTKFDPAKHKGLGDFVILTDSKLASKQIKKALAICEGLLL